MATKKKAKSAKKAAKPGGTKAASKKKSAPQRAGATRHMGKSELLQRTEPQPD
ncbi:MAG: hypothetical protein M3081_12310 [Gemmatimonadota bacterium]|nr:hypothetical protein [Gemmatimonadota bacterium]